VLETAERNSTPQAVEGGYAGGWVDAIGIAAQPSLVITIQQGVREIGAFNQGFAETAA
jgi:hypothetical protein